VTNRQHLTGAQAVIATLRAHSVDTIFGIPGVHTLPIYDAIYHEEGLRHVLARHEQGAGFMAEGYARASGRVGVVCTITGPGVTNVATPVANAYADSVPLLVISSTLPRMSQGHGRGELHEVKDQLGVMQALTGWSRSVSHVEEIPDALADAFRSMCLGRPRGAYLQIPLDLLESTASVEIPVPAPIEPARPSAEAIVAAVQLLRRAKRPLIIAGAGVTAARANEQLALLAERLQAPVILGSKSHDVLPSDHPLVVATNDSLPPELDAFVAQCDVVLVVGSKLGSERTAGQRLPLSTQLIHIDIDPAEIGHNYPAHIGIATDAKAALEALLYVLRDYPQRPSTPPSNLSELREALHNHMLRIHDETFSMLEGVRNGLRDLPRDTIIVADMTMLGYASAQYLPTYNPRTFIHPAEFCTIGCGLPLALGAQVAAPQRKVLTLCGDGGFLLNASELATAAQEQLPVIAVIFNDSTFTTVKKDQQKRFPNRYIATDLLAPDYVALARAFHATGIRVETPRELAQAIQEAARRSGPTVIDAQLPPHQW